MAGPTHERVALVADTPDVYADAFQFSSGPNGCTLNFLLGDATPPPAGHPPRNERVATVRVSLELAKVMAFAMRMALRQFEQASGITVNVSRDVLNQLHFSPEDWNAMWGE